MNRHAKMEQVSCRGGNVHFRLENNVSYPLRMAINLSYTFSPEALNEDSNSGLQLENPLFSLLSAIRDEGSIGQAAGRLRLSYRYVWGYLKKQEQMFGQRLLISSQGEAARLSEFGERLLWAEKRMLARLLPSAEAMATKLDNELLLAIRPELQSVTVCASHDLLFGTLRENVLRQADVLLDVEYLGSAKALEKLNQEACTLAGMHIPLEVPHLSRRGSGIHNRIGRQLRLGEHKLIRLAAREQGLIVAAGNPLGLRSIFDLAQDGVAFVNRQPGSGTRILFDELLAINQIPEAAVQGYGTSESTHLSVAAAIAAGMADCGFGLRAAAARFGLGFVPLLKEQYFIVCHKSALDTPAVQSVVDVLGSEEFRRLADAVPGYSAAGSGQIVSLRRTLPWYK